MGFGTTILCGLLLLPCCANQTGKPEAATRLERYSYAETHMGVPFRISVYASDKVVANKAVAKAYKRIAELNRVFSDYLKDSEVTSLRTLPAGGQVQISPDLAALLVRSIAMSQRTDGAFDVTVGPLVRLWRRARRRKQLPEPELLAKAREQSGFRLLKLSEQTLSVEASSIRLDFGAIAKGYACDEAIRVLRVGGIRHALVDGGGDIAVSEPPPNRDAWRIQIEPEKKGEPAAALVLKCQSVATSGDRYRFVEIDGKKYSHIVDPRTGLGLINRLTVTVVAANATDADALASAVSVLGSTKGLQLIESWPGAECSIRDHSGKDVRVVSSSGFARLVDAAASDESRGQATIPDGP